MMVTGNTVTRWKGLAKNNVWCHTNRISSAFFYSHPQVAIEDCFLLKKPLCSSILIQLFASLSFLLLWSLLIDLIFNFVNKIEKMKGMIAKGVEKTMHITSVLPTMTEITQVDKTWLPETFLPLWICFIPFFRSILLLMKCMFFIASVGTFSETGKTITQNKMEKLSVARAWSILVAAVPDTGKEMSCSLRLYDWEGRECASL